MKKSSMGLRFVLIFFLQFGNKISQLIKQAVEGASGKL
nr:MAG TPA: hypothetical protein [Bacteriophage sp.]